MEKFQVKFSMARLDGTLVEQVYNLRAENRAEMEKKVLDSFPSAVNLSVRTLAGVLDEQIREHIQKIKIDIGEVKKDDNWANERMGEIKSTLRCCADAAYMFGTDSQESLERSLGRMVESGHVIYGLDVHMFSFGIRYSFGAYGALIFHCSAKDWSTHS
jgi:hypothetical protein